METDDLVSNTNIPKVSFVITVFNPVQKSGNTIILDGGSSSLNDGTIASYQWSQPDRGQTTVELNNANSAAVSFIATPELSGETLWFQLTVTGSNGKTNSSYFHFSWTVETVLGEQLVQVTDSQNTTDVTGGTNALGTTGTTVSFGTTDSGSVSDTAGTIYPFGTTGSGGGLDTAGTTDSFGTTGSGSGLDTAGATDSFGTAGSGSGLDTVGTTDSFGTTGSDGASNSSGTTDSGGASDTGGATESSGTTVTPSNVRSLVFGRTGDYLVHSAESVFIADQDSDQILHLNAMTGTELNRFDLDYRLPNKLAYSESEYALYVSFKVAGVIAKINIDTDTDTDTVDTTYLTSDNVAREMAIYDTQLIYTYLNKNTNDENKLPNW